MMTATNLGFHAVEPPPPKHLRLVNDRSRPNWVVVVGASRAEGLTQLQRFVAVLPPDFRAAVVVVQDRLVEVAVDMRSLLEGAGGLPVVVPAEGEPLRAGVCYVGAPDRHLSIGDADLIRLELDPRYRNRGMDLLFNSAAEYLGPRAIGVILAGGLNNGARGLLAIKRKGGVAMVVDADGSGKRAALAAIGDIDAACPVDAIAASLVRRTTERKQLVC